MVILPMTLVTLNPQTIPILVFLVAFQIFVVSKHKDFIYDIQLVDRS